MHNDNYNLTLMYNLADNRPYCAGPSHVVPQATFKISYPNFSNQPFVLTTIPQLKK
jgi:hypothetical protein